MRRNCWIAGFLFILFAIGLHAQEVVSNALLARTDSAVQAVAWSPNGKFFATSWNNSVILWEASSNTICAIWSGHKKDILSAKFSADSQWFLSVGDDNSIIIRNIDEKISAIKITGDGSYPIQDAAFAENGYSVMAPLDGVNIAHCFRLVMTNQFIFKGVTTSIAAVSAVDMNPRRTKLLVTQTDGTVRLYNLEGEVKGQSFPRYADSKIPAVFSPDGNYFLSAADRTSLSISPVDGPGAFSIRDSDMPVNAAVYHPSGKKIAAALRNGLVKVYNVSDGSVEKAYSILVERGDVVESLAYSPNGDSLVAGTRKGYIFRWSPEGKAFVPIRRAFMGAELEKLAEVYSDQTVVRDVRTNKEEVASEVTEDSEDGKKSAKNKDKPLNGVELYLKGNNINSKYYYGAFGLGGVYRNYYLSPLYWGAGAELSAFIPNGEYPFETYNPEKYGRVWIYSAAVFGLAGLSFYMPEQSLLIFTEGRIGVSAKISFNNNFKYYQVGGPAVSPAFDVLTGVQWKFLRLTLGTQFDTGFNFMFKGSLGYVIQFKPKASKPAAQPSPEQPEPFEEEKRSKF